MASEQPGQQEGDFSEPEPRRQACGTVVQGKFILYRGLQESFKKLNLHNFPRVSEVHDFNHSPPAWETRQTTGPTPQAVHGSACTCIGPDLYVFAGRTASQYTNELHAFNTVEALWRQLCPRNPSEGPMRKAFCGMIAIDATTLVIVAGRGFLSGDIQPGSRFVKDTHLSDGSGWTNELHTYNLNIDLWSSPTTSGVTLPPCSGFTLTKVDLLRAVLFAGLQGDIRRRVSTAYVLSFHDWNWAVLHLNGPYQPVARQAHTAFSLQDPNSNPAHPRLVISCGVDGRSNPLRDMCILSVNDGSCEEIPLPLSFIARYYHTCGVFYMSSGKVKAVYFGGLTDKRDPKKSWKEWALTAHTTVVKLECEVRGEGSAAGWRATVNDPRALELVHRAEAIYSEALQHGYTEDRPIVVLLTGAAGSGKSHVRNLLLNLPPPPVRHSTALAESPVRAISATTAVAPADSGLFHLIKEGQENQLLAHSIASGGRSSDIRSPPTIASSPVEERLQNTQQGEQEVASVSQHQSQPSPPTPAPVGDQQPAVQPEPQHPDLTPHTDSPTDIATYLDSGFSGESNLDSDASGVVAQLGDDVKALINPASKSNISIPQGDSIYIMDSGGQPQFPHIFPLFMQPPLVTLHVTNLSERLDQHPVVEYYKHGKALGQSLISPFTNEQLIMYSARGSEANTYNLTSTSTSPTAKLLIIGTHRDRESVFTESRAKKIERITARLCPHFNKHLVFCGNNQQSPIFPLNAKQPQECDCAIMREVRGAIKSAHDSVGSIKTPTAWQVLKKGLHKLAEKKCRMVLSKQECLEVARCVHINAEQLEVALCHLACLALIHYFPEILPEVVFCQSQVLLDKLTEIVECWYQLHSSTDSTAATDSTIIPFQKEGMVSCELLARFPSHYVFEGNLFTPAHFLHLMKRRHLVAKVSEAQYFMPAILPELSEKELEKQRVASSSPVAPLAFHSPDGIPPCGLFCSVVSSLLSSGELELAREPKNRIHPKLVALNCVRFLMPHRLPGEVVLVDAFTHFELHVHSSIVFSDDAYSNLRCSILKALKNIADSIDSFNVKVETGFICDKRTHMKLLPRFQRIFTDKLACHVATVSSDGQYWMCSKDPRQVYGSLQREHLIWNPLAEPLETNEDPQLSAGDQVQSVPSAIAVAAEPAVTDESATVPQPPASEQVQLRLVEGAVSADHTSRALHTVCSGRNDSEVPATERDTGASAVENPETNLGRESATVPQPPASEQVQPHLVEGAVSVHHTSRELHSICSGRNDSEVPANERDTGASAVENPETNLGRESTTVPQPPASEQVQPHLAEGAVSVDHTSRELHSVCSGRNDSEVPATERDTGASAVENPETNLGRGFISTFSHLQPVLMRSVLVVILFFLLGVVLSVWKVATDATGTSSLASHQHPVTSAEGLWKGGGVFASTAYVYVGKAEEYSFLGFKMKAPANALPDSVTEISFLIEAVPPSKLQIPEDTLLVSGLYRIRSSHAFRKPATVYIQHCVDLDSTPLLTNHLSFFISKDQQVQLLDGGEFNATEIENYGSIKRTDFCFFGILLNAISKLFPLRPIRYMAHLYEGAFYTITRDLEAEEKVARAQMKVRDDAVHIPLAVKFTDPGGDAEILLDFPDHEGCIIHHDCYPGITRQQVDDFVAGVTTLPRVKLDLQWKGNSSLEENRIRIELKGAKPPRNYFNVECTIHLSSASGAAAAVASCAQPEPLAEEPKCHDIESKKELRDAVSEIGNWFELCSNLGVEEATMNGLKNSLKQDTFKKTECLSAYVDQGEACWEEVVKVVSEHPFFNNRVASVIRDNYCTDKL